MLDEIKDVNASLWISASAGTGKTKSLIDRILALLLNGINPSKILCITYTKAAAFEMLTRLSNCIEKLSKIPNSELKSELLKLGFDESYAKIARSLFEKSIGDEWVSIQTIHSFCFKLLERFPIETGLFPSIKLCDDYMLRQFVDESVNFVLSNSLYHENLVTISEYTTNLFNIIKDNAIDIHDFLDKLGDFKKVYSEFFNVDSDWVNFNDEEVNNLLFEKFFQNNHKKIFHELSDVLFRGGATDVEKAKILQKNSNNPIGSFVDAFLTKDGTIRKVLCTKNVATDDFLEKMRCVAQKALNFSDIKKRYISAKANIALFEIIEVIFCKFRELKVVNHCLDFDDVIRLTLSLLENMNWVMYKIDEWIDHILIDEAQDTSLQQWNVIKMITDEFFSHSNPSKTIFVVGDEKQSIYSFQGADIRLFRKMHDDFRKKSEACGQKFYDVNLNTSYRTSGNILSFIDDALIEKFPNISHYTNRNPCGGVVEVIDVFEDENQDDDCVENSEDAWEKLSTYIANFINSTIKKHIFVESRNRAAEAEDFLILFQHRNMKAMNYIIGTLKMANVPVAEVDRIFLRDELIVEDLIALAEFSVFPLDDLMCARVLKSPIIGITENDLMKICIDRKEDILWEYLQKIKYSQLGILLDYMDKALKLSAYDFFIYVLMDGAKEKFIKRLGEKCINVLQEFLSVVMNYENENTASLQSFLHWFRSFEHEVKRESFKCKNSVRLMTIHASKGLQSPFVILADCHFMKTKSNRLLKTEEGLLLWDFSNNFRPTEIAQLCADRQQAEDDEFYRLLYVAMTRAEDFLYILGEKHKKLLDDKCWYNFIKRKLDKFERDDNECLHRIGNYTSTNLDANKANEVHEIEIPKWLNERIPSLKEDSQDIPKNQSMVYGDCVHLLLNEMPMYFGSSLYNKIADQLLENFDLQKTEKDMVKTETFEVIRKFDFLFDSKSQSEVSFVYDGKEGRIDKIARYNGSLLIVDFKAGTPHFDIADNYISQLNLYRKAVQEITSESNIKTAILWTQIQELIEIAIPE